MVNHPNRGKAKPDLVSLSQAVVSMREANDRLRDVNADLLAACQDALTAATKFFDGDIMAEAERVRNVLRVAIAKATQS